MGVHLDPAVDRPLLDGARGPGVQLAMRVIVRMADVAGADSLIDISAAHIDSSLYLGEAPLEFIERLADLGARVVVPSTCNVGGVDEGGWKAAGVSPRHAERALRQMKALVRMGCKPTWTCAPYQNGHRPGRGDHVAWGESNAVVFANAVLGARTERYPDLLDISAALTGRVPAVGLHLDEGRAGQILVRVHGLPLKLRQSDDLYPVLGHVVGAVAGERVPVVDGLDVTPTEDQLKAFGAAAATSGAVALFHLPGVTPEAPTLEEAFLGGEPLETVTVDLERLRAARRRLCTTEDERLDGVVLGSPHFSLDEIRRLAALVEGRTRQPGVRFMVTTSRVVRAVAQSAGLIEPLQGFGAEIVVDTCVLTSPVLATTTAAVLMTSSAKYAHYLPSLLGCQVVLGSVEDCVVSAERGRILVDESLWHA